MTGQGRDPRALFANNRVAHENLEGKVKAQRFTPGRLMRVTVPTLPVHRSEGALNLEREVLFGAELRCLDIENGRAFVQDAQMGYVGYVPAEGIAPWFAPTHCVTVRSTLMFLEPDFKSPCPIALPMGAQVTILSEEGRYGRMAEGAYVILDHLGPLRDASRDPVSIAETLLGTPYLWGGNSAFGIDCSGLVQCALAICGVPCPGDSDQQQAALGETVPEGSAPKRGDLMFWKGHVAWVADETRLIHANAHHMAVAYENIASACARIAVQGGGPVTRHARLTPLAG